jgi:fatty-acyl-CoA synthase
MRHAGQEVALTGNAKIKAGELRELAAKRLAESGGLQ